MKTIKMYRRAPHDQILSIFIIFSLSLFVSYLFVFHLYPPPQTCIWKFQIDRNTTEITRSNSTTKGHIKSASVSSPGPSNESTGQTDTLRQRLEIDLNRLCFPFGFNNSFYFLCTKNGLSWSFEDAFRNPLNILFFAIYSIFHNLQPKMTMFWWWVQLIPSYDESKLHVVYIQNLLLFEAQFQMLFLPSTLLHFRT